MRPVDLESPLSQFQTSVTDKEDTFKMLISINKALEEKGLPEEQLKKSFEKWWPELEQALGKLIVSEVDEAPLRSGKELIEEILELVRKQSSPLGLKDCKTEEDYNLFINQFFKELYGYHLDTGSLYEYLRKRMFDPFFCRPYNF
jgi:hypothetical protein